MTEPVKPIYGVHDFHAQLVIPLSQNPPAQPIDGSVYIDTDENRIYAYRGGTWVAGDAAHLAELDPHGMYVKIAGDTMIGDLQMGDKAIRTANDGKTGLVYTGYAEPIGTATWLGSDDGSVGLVGNDHVILMANENIHLLASHFFVGGIPVESVGAPVADDDAATKAYVDGRVVAQSTPPADTSVVWIDTS